MNKPYTKIVFLIGISIATALLAMTSCTKKDDFNFDKMAQNQYESDWAVPVINKKYTLGELILDTANYVMTDPTDQFLTVVYNTGDIWSATAEDLFTLPDQTFDQSQNIPVSAPLAGQYHEVSYSKQIDLSVGAFVLDTVLLKDGSLIAAINTNINHAAIIEVTIPDIRNNIDMPLSFSINMPYGGGAEMASGSNTVSLVGYKMAIQTGNKININYKVKVYGDSYPFSSPSYDVQINTQLKELKYKYMIGYFGQVSKSLIDTASIRLFKDHYENSLFLSKINAHLYMRNSFGMPIRFQVNNFTVYNNEGVVNNVMTPGYTVDGPYPTLSQFGQTIYQHDTTPLDPAALTISPKFMAFNALATLNPDNNPAIKNFVSDDSKFSIDARLELPMEGKIQNFSYRDTLEFSFKDIDQIEYTNFHLYIENAFPVNGKIQVYFADSNYHFIDSLMSQQSIIPAATTGPAPSYRTINNGIKTTDIILDRARINRLTEVKYVIIEGKLTSYNNTTQNVRIYGNQFIYVILGTRVKIKTNY